MEVVKVKMGCCTMFSIKLCSAGAMSSWPSRCFSWTGYKVDLAMSPHIGLQSHAAASWVWMQR